MDEKIEERKGLTETYQKICEKIWNISRNELYLSMRFLDGILASLPYQLNKNTFFVGTDGTFLYYNPRFLMERYEWKPVVVNRAYLHMILHGIFRHIWKREGKREEYWDTACDIVVESMIDSMEYPAVQALVSDIREELYEQLHQKYTVLTAEKVYEYLLENQISGKKFMKINAEFLVDDHSFWYQERKNDQKQEEQEQQSREQNQDQEQREQDNNQSSNQSSSQGKQEEWKKLANQLKTNMETFKKQVGKQAGTLVKALQVETREKQDFPSFLKRFATLQEEIQVDLDSFDYAFYYYGMELYGNMPLIEEVEYRENHKIQEFVIAIDTSGSCSGQLVKDFIKQTFSILKNTESFFQKICVHIIQCDACIQEDIEIVDQEKLDQYLENFEVKGHGGTDYRPVFQYVEQLKSEGKLKKLKGLLYFTDGYGIYPEKRTSYDTVFVFPDNFYYDQEVPPWAIKLVYQMEHS